ncbi:MAG: hypothetical protein WC479_12135 [Candidatus Izemoplasmatales bacterium]
MKDDVNKRLCELLGMCWHEQIDNQTLQCKHCGAPMLFPWQQNQDFVSPSGRIDLLKRMRERGDFQYFTQYAFPDKASLWDLILDNTGALSQVALEFLEASHD